MPDIDNIKSINLAVIIVNRGKGKQIVKLLKEVDVSYHMIALGDGTAPTEMQAYWGFGETEKDVVFAFVSDEQSQPFNQILKQELCTKKPNMGIAFTIPISSVSGVKELKYFLGETEE